MKALKRLGQNFLKNRIATMKIVGALEIEKDDVIIEIGPGKGQLTKKILDKTDKLIAIEKDKRLIDSLKSLSNSSNFKVLEGDIRDLLIEESGKLGEYKIVGNIPYYLTGQLLRIFQELKNPPKIAVLMVQKEVARRIIGREKNTQLSAIISLWADSEILMNLNQKDFNPAPKVKSSVIRLNFKSLKDRLKNEEKIISLIKIGYSSPRKTLVNNLTKKWEKEKIEVALKRIGLGGRSRPEDLSVKDWIELKKMI